MDLHNSGAGGASLIAQRQEKFELGVWLALSRWQALTVAVQNLWGGPDSEDKRDWFAGAVVELFTDPTQPTPEQEDVEERLLQVMQDEFEVAVEDGTSTIVAVRVMAIWEETGDGNFSTVDRLHAEWQERKNRQTQAVSVQNVEPEAASEDGDSVDDESDDDDVEMGDAPALVPARERIRPVVDEDGFTQVVSKKKR
ncbi:gb [Venturia nashicola]|uniref:Gb n=1 Tax=Venturia nashicola TaxID=86259 RepID=A0A4Z1P3E4_9PEZI|nr:gb [Venturia nashicola]